VPLDTWDGAQDELRRLRTGTTFTIDDLFRLADQSERKLDELYALDSALRFAMRPASSADLLLDGFSWGLGTIGYLVSCADYYETGSLSLFGWLGLAIGQLIPSLTDDHPYAHSRSPMDMMVHG
jgi:hypothetical protein